MLFLVLSRAASASCKLSSRKGGPWGTSVRYQQAFACGVFVLAEDGACLSK
jgi:hypothetical protein